MTKATYNMYSYTISGMSREVMKMDYRGSTESQFWQKKDIDGIIGFVLNENKTR